MQKCTCLKPATFKCENCYRNICVSCLFSPLLDGFILCPTCNAFKISLIDQPAIFDIYKVVYPTTKQAADFLQAIQQRNNVYKMLKEKEGGKLNFSTNPSVCGIIVVSHE